MLLPKRCLDRNLCILCAGIWFPLYFVCRYLFSFVFCVHVFVFLGILYAGICFPWLFVCRYFFSLVFCFLPYPWPSVAGDWCLQLVSLLLLFTTALYYCSLLLLFTTALYFQRYTHKFAGSRFPTTLLLLLFPTTLYYYSLVLEIHTRLQLVSLPLLFASTFYYCSLLLPLTTRDTHTHTNTHIHGRAPEQAKHIKGLLHSSETLVVTNLNQPKLNQQGA